ncbi:peptide-methionine (R)-S-oxide reductase MsrB [Evansella sp. AB-P1]|uniref:peptide-methionine (R)-S-oxide reductase MsrB n=1 Tax=Evansella sp. AB-P1 TaxID=3037653 RepID=UPI00241D4AC6|nr:peptide-methionine (R)-S-oxide reductase MsrB [Evansella sp. AB-P1]MDG5786731.1 peptide-methionine (R)-S-oxide reductase MsrB [Evansella sp. AB-P1]
MEERERERDHYSVATFAGGPFIFLVPPFERVNGVRKITCGYTGGYKNNPTHKEVLLGYGGHFQAIQITYDPIVSSFNNLLNIFWKQIDPTDFGGQFHNRGDAYGTAIFYHCEKQKLEAEKSKFALAQSNQFSSEIVTEILPAATFNAAKEFHQSFHKKHPFRFKIKEERSGRREGLRELWLDPREDARLKKSLSPLQYDVTQKNKTEPPYENPYWDNKKEGIYVDIITGVPLFTSLAQYDAGCGWPSFTTALHDENIVKELDVSRDMTRIEVRSKEGDSHLGHVFEDGPKEEGGLRYCINSAALRFIPKEDLVNEGYKEYVRMFSK